MAMGYPLPTAVANRSEVTLERLKRHLNYDPGYTDDDVRLASALNRAKADVDKTLWNYFTDDDLPTGNPQPIPPDVEEFILHRAARFFEWNVERQNYAQLNQVGQTSTSGNNVDDYEDIMHLRDPLGLVGF